MFRDMNVNVSAFQRLFTNDVRRCEDTERRLRYFEDQLKREQAKRPRRTLRSTVSENHAAAETLDSLEPHLESLENKLRELSSKWEQLVSQRNSMKEHLEILIQDPSFFHGEETSEMEYSSPGTTTQAEEDPAVAMRAGCLRYLTGVIRSDLVALFELLVFRATRGNVFMRINEAREPFEDPLTGEQVQKAVFVVFFSAARAAEKIRKLCESLQASVFPYVIRRPQERQNLEKVHDFLMELETTITGTDNVRAELLAQVEKNITQWKKTIVTEKSVFNVLNMLDVKGQTVVAECWAPEEDVDCIRAALTEAERSSGAQMESIVESTPNHEVPPTYFKTNKFTSVHQIGIFVMHVFSCHV